eukprot:symbB.v1.2.001542.t1/scaffold85.1/size341090/2
MRNRNRAVLEASKTLIHVRLPTRICHKRLKKLLRRPRILSRKQDNLSRISRLQRMTGTKRKNSTMILTRNPK